MTNKLKWQFAKTIRTVSGLDRLKERFDQVEVHQDMRFEALAKQIADLSNRTSAMHNQIAAMANEVNGISNRTIDATSRMAKLEQQSASSVQATAILASGYVARHLNFTRDHTVTPANYKPATAPPLEKSLEALRALSPAIFPHWQRLFDNAVSHYQGGQEASSSVWGHKYAQLFGAYVNLFAKGRVLDVGCGINGKPVYLAGMSNDKLSGLEPLSQPADPGFECVQGFNEFLPWPGGAFDTVVSGTSLDHVFSLEKSLSEVVRVLVPGGRYLVWLASIAGSPPFEPDAPDFKPRDEFHLFHFDRAWIEPLFAKFFDFQDVTIIPQPGFDHVFYCLTSKRV